MIEDTTTTSTSVVIVVSVNQEAIQVPEGMVIEKRVPDLLSLLESHVNEATTEISVVPRTRQQPLLQLSLQLVPTKRLFKFLKAW